MSVKTDVDNRQWRMGNNRYRRVIVKGADPETFKAASLLEYDPADDKYKAYTGGVITDIPSAIINLDADFELDGDTEFTASILIAGDVFSDKLNLPGAFAIDDRPNGASFSIREYLRQWGIFAYDSTGLTENNIS